MTWAILLAFLLVIGVMSLAGRRQVPWANQMRRVNAGSSDKAEWMAPENIVQQVIEDYQTIMRWLPESMLHDWAEQWSAAPYYLSGAYLRRHQEILKRQRMGQPPRYTGVMRCVHQLEVRHFSDDGEHCLVVDHQFSRRMATYDLWTQQRVNTQDLGDATLVYEMVYDKQSGRWKLDRYIQELPIGWRGGKSAHRVRLINALPRSIGRDN